IAGNVAGEVLAWDLADPATPQILRGSTGQPVESVDLLDSGGIERLVIADRSRELTALVLGDHYERPYHAGRALVRRAAALPDLLLAMNDTRDRLLAWDPREPAEPLASIVIPHLTGEPIQDIALIPG